MNILKATIATAAITVCCMGNDYPAKAQSMHPIQSERMEHLGLTANAICMNWMDKVTGEQTMNYVMANTNASLDAWWDRVPDAQLQNIVGSLAAGLYREQCDADRGIDAAFKMFPWLPRAIHHITKVRSSI